MGPRFGLAAGPFPVYVAKGARVYVSGLLSIIIPFYLSVLHYDLFFQGLALVAILAGGAVSNLSLTYFENTLGRGGLLQLFSLLMLAAGAILAIASSPVPILVACFIGNISTTGTEAGPFQSIEAGILPDLVGEAGVVRAFGRYNLIGYAAAAVGTLTSSVPDAYGSDPQAFRWLFAGFGLVGLLLFVIYRGLGTVGTATNSKPGLNNLGPEARKEVVRLSGLFSLDAFGGVFVSQYLLSTWFRLTFGLPLTSLAPIFFTASVIAAVSTYGAALIAERIGNLRTMVYTHLVSSAFLLMIALGGSLAVSLAFLFLRQSFSQMDVPTRQALMAEMFQKTERVSAYAFTNTVRSAGQVFGGPVAASLLGAGFASGLLFAGGSTKIVYDLLVFSTYRKRFR